MARGAHEIPQYGNVWAVSADAARIHGQAEAFGEVEVHARIVQFRKAKTRRGQHAVHAGRIDGPGWPVTPPRAPRQLVELLPIAFLPSRHCFFVAPNVAGAVLLLVRIAQPIGCSDHPKGSPAPVQTRQTRHRALKAELSIYSTINRLGYFPSLMFQTRYGAICFSLGMASGGWKAIPNARPWRGRRRLYTML